MSHSCHNVTPLSQCHAPVTMSHSCHNVTPLSQCHTPVTMSCKTTHRSCASLHIYAPVTMPYKMYTHTIHLEHCALLAPLCLQFLASILRLLAEDLSLSLAPLSGIPYLYLSDNFKKKLKTHLFEKHLE